jgi:quinol-cytochrome oxidoreductase complex cytochrome b subunit
MKAIIIVVLAAQAAIFLVTVYAILFTPMARSGRRRPIWASFAITLVIVSGTSWNIGNNHAGQPGADILMYCAPLLLGMGIMAALLMIRSRRELDGPG